jgi:hypothetical protein
MARLKKVFPCSGISEKSISLSRKASILTQLVRERFLVEDFFTAVGLSCWNDPNSVRLAFRECNDHKSSTDESEANLSHLAIISSGIGADQHRPGKYLRDISEIHSVFSEIRRSLGFVPFKSHEQSYIHIVCTSNTFFRSQDGGWVDGGPQPGSCQLQQLGEHAGNGMHYLANFTTDRNSHGLSDGSQAGFSTLSTSAIIVCSPLAPAGCGRTSSAICGCPFVSQARTATWNFPRLGGRQV